MHVKLRCKPGTAVKYRSCFDCRNRSTRPRVTGGDNRNAALSTPIGRGTMVA